MSYRKFGKNDVLINTIRTHPRVDLFIYSGTIFYNGVGNTPGAFRSQHNNVYMTDPGYENLYEYNIDRTAVEIEGTRRSDGSITTGSNPLIYPYIVKDGSRTELYMSGVFPKSEYDSLGYGDLFTGSYPQFASIQREFITSPSGSCNSLSKADCGHNFSFFSLKNMLNHYSALSEHYSVVKDPEHDGGWNKNSQTLNLIHIPSIFYGSKIKPGTVSLKWYLTGSLIGELRDEKENGELIQTLPTGSTSSGSVAGVVLYSEGFLLLTGSWDLNNTSLDLVDGATAKPKWIYWGAGARDGLPAPSGSGATSLLSASFELSFEATTKTQVLTMYARAAKGAVNYSNNPTFLEYGQDQLTFTSSHVYEENKNRKMKNTVSSSYSNYNEDYNRQVYISKVAVYDEYKNLIGIATLANPVLKEEDRDLAFKIKLDI